MKSWATQAWKAVGRIVAGDSRVAQTPTVSFDGEQPLRLMAYSNLKLLCHNYFGPLYPSLDVMVWKGFPVEASPDLLGRGMKLNLS